MILQVLIGVLSGLIVGHLRESQHLNSKIEFSPRRISSPNLLSLTISPQIWVPDQNVDLTVNTGNFDPFEDTEKVNLMIDLFYNEVQPSSSASGVKYYHQGKIKNFRKLEISPNSDYSIKFKPPAILKDGAHTVVVSISETSDEDGNEQILMHAVTTVEVRNGRKTDDISVHDDSPSPNQPNNKAISASFNEIPLEHVISRIDSLSDLCRLCRSSLSVQKKCDDIFEHSFPKLYQLPFKRREFGGLKDQPPLTTIDICRFDLIEQHLERLEFKYIYYSSDLDFPKIKQPIELIKKHVFKLHLASGNPMNDNRSLAILLDKELLVKKPDYLKQWKGMEAKSRLQILNQIIEW
ncbi:hypothetical protein BKA69DRAFT_1100124 [Paraphysoderma sedebokerense]|nr:hypothetical protein BKA69DRAFT_1100124 [Paraphysoderma sedebokerense]